MFIRHLHLLHYRNYERLDLSFDNKINIFQGFNAQGKTNVLEAIYMLALAKSHRTSKEKELVQWGQSFSVIKADIEKKNGSLKLEMQLSNKGKKAKVNQLEQRKLSDYIGALNIVMFAPEDLSLVKGNPQHRRRFIDIEIGQISPSYLHQLSQYQKVIQQRNNLLKDFRMEKKNRLEMLEIYNLQLIQYGTKVMKKRMEFLDKLNRWAKEIHFGITNNKENLEIKYQSSISKTISESSEVEISNQYEQKLLKVQEQELERGVSLVGPHRDDLEFFINEISVQAFGSQGQQRNTALSLKLAEIELIYEEVGEYPILLLDDVLSELDFQRQTQLIHTIRDKVQTFITTTGTESIDEATLKQSSLFYVEAGKITQLN